MQTVTVQIRLFPSHPSVLVNMGNEYIRTVNLLTEQAEASGTFPKLTSKNIDANLPSVVKNQLIRDARSIFQKSRKNKKRPILKKRVYYVNNQNYTIGDDSVSFPACIDGKVQRLVVPAYIAERERNMLANSKQGLLRVVQKSNKWFVHVSVEKPTGQATGTAEMGVDLGLKVPAVVVTSNGKTKFFGNGRKNKFIRRTYNARRRKLGKRKKLSAIRKQRGKESRYIKDQNHKISRQIVTMAQREHVSVIKLEKLSDIRKTTRTSRKNAKNLHSWSFYQLQQFIAYKSALAGIQVIEVNPAYTSQTCPSCGERNQAKDRMYQCFCGYAAHRDRVGAINIMRQPVADGVRPRLSGKAVGE
ncbi:transposase, IS605 OrfB family, central region [Paenibacillus sp. UNCCL117]|uniref:RNA-guided endonuclease TnpB family protein n=1 Tax=unclassified Paenibacillus TaxID=185978 RepID=UPI00088FCCFD|nr:MULTISPECIES: RNA-guided endonuclease TnpB family protein [unclassified Paenibacillus]SDD78180.1 transposase, IS605 OrfB family, central region [Paenibacillus sp. cl123]SFW52915.1 transposase, IS605 OrfB family, central region [Paenibacillus sp. UNCCL117]